VERRLWRGVSWTETLAQARATARRAPILGTFVAALDLPATPRFRAERTGSRVGHYTAWSDANALLARVVSGGWNRRQSVMRSSVRDDCGNLPRDSMASVYYWLPLD